MYSFLHGLLSDRSEEPIFTCFGLWHLLFLAVLLLLTSLILLLTRKKSTEVKEKVARFFLNLAFGLYMADFFLMPFAYGEIDIEKLPFHACTAMCVMCFLSHHVNVLKKYRIHFTALGLISNLVYVIYPAGVMWHSVCTFSYRVIQTLLFHGLMTVYGLITVLYDHEIPSFTTLHRDLTTIAGMTVWALLGNYLYYGYAGIESYSFNWFFVVRDPFSLLPERIAPFIMPFLTSFLFFLAEMLLFFFLFLIKGSLARRGRATLS